MILSVMVLTAEGWAFPIVDQTFQVGHAINLDDVDIPSGNGEDYFPTDAIYLARHAFVVLYEEPSHTPVRFGFTDDVGDVTFNSLDKAKQYKLELRGWPDYNDSGRDLFVRDASGNIETALSGAINLTSSSHLGIAPTTINVAFAASATAGTQWINAAAIGSWVIRRMPGAFPTQAQNGAEYTIVMEDPQTGCNPDQDLPAVYCSWNQTVFIDPANPYAWKRKHIIAHEFAHELQHWAMVPNTSSNPDNFKYFMDYEAESDFDSCQDFDGYHSFVSYEYQSAAIVEGMAHYITAVAFNNVNQSDCRYDSGGGAYVWVFGESGEIDQFSCEGYDPASGNPLGADNGGIEWTAFQIPAGDFFGLDTDGTGANLACSANSTTSNRGTELDWMRFFWDLDNKEGLVAADILDAWVLADANSWATAEATVYGDLPKVRLNDAFDDLFFDTEWDNQAIGNGVWR